LWLPDNSGPIGVIWSVIEKCVPQIGFLTSQCGPVLNNILIWSQIIPLLG
jgi:hypothetical protein